VVILGISLGAIVLSCILMAMLFGRYGFSTKVSSTTTPSRTVSLA